MLKSIIGEIWSIIDSGLLLALPKIHLWEIVHALYYATGNAMEIINYPEGQVPTIQRKFVLSFANPYAILLQDT